ncbi:unnamed protein product [Parajaminaea phylloscopi]
MSSHRRGPHPGHSSATHHHHGATDTAADEGPHPHPHPHPRPHSTASAQVKPLIRVRLINIDHVCTSPGPYDRVTCAFLPPGEELRKVPVLRVFGATPSGQRVCLHLHGVFPYCYIPYQGDMKPDSVLWYITRLGIELNAAITASLRGDPSAPESRQHLAAIHLVKGVPFYGYHVGWTYFLKISFVDPSHNYRIATILQSGRVLRTVFQPHEIHIRYQLQFMLDYNIFGCDYIDLETARFRLPVPASPEGSSSQPHLQPCHDAAGPSASPTWDESTIPADLVQSHEVHRTSFCDIEIDAAAKHVINRRRLRERHMHHDFDTDDRLGANEKLVPSLTGLWEEESARRVKAGLSPTPPAPDPTRDVRIFKEGESPEWMGEDRFRQLWQARLALDARSQRSTRPRDLTRPHPLDSHISTAFASVELFHFAAEDLENLSSNVSNGTPLPGTLFDLEHYATQGSQALKHPSHADQDDASVSSSLDAGFFGTQAFQTHLDEVERQHALQYDSDAESDAPAGPEDATPGQTSLPSAPSTPQRTRQAPAPSTGTSSQRPVPTTPSDVNSARKTPLLRSALKTPSKTLAAQDEASVRFLSPLRNVAGNGRDSSPSASPVPTSAVSTSPAGPPPQTQTQAQTQSQASTDHTDLVLGSSQWLAAHIKSQTRWRNTANTRYAATQQSASGGKPTGPSADTFGSTVPALTQLAESSGATRSDVSALSAQQAPKDTLLCSYIVPPPSRIEVASSLSLFGLPPVEYQDPFYSNPADVPLHAREYAGRSWRFAAKTIKYLTDFPSLVDPGAHLTRDTKGTALAQEGRAQALWEYGKPPPTRGEVIHWLDAEEEERRRTARRQARKLKKLEMAKPKMSGPTQAAAFGFKISQRQPAQNKTPDGREKQHMTVFAIEVHANSRRQLQPDPKVDPIQCIAYSFQNEDETLYDTGSRPGLRTGLIIFDGTEDDSDSKGGCPPFRPDRMGLSHLPVTVVNAELDMFNALIDLVRELDPEILVGYEIHNGSWGYVIERARHHLGYELVPELGRVNNLSTGTAGGKADSWGWTQTSALKITGRHILNIWRLMRGELNLNQYTYENVVFHLLRSRVPRFPSDQLTQWYKSQRPHHVARVLKYWIERVETDLLILETSGFVFRTAEFARIYGIDFFSVISRGSQFKVESVMFRIAKPESFLLPSPNSKQVAESNAAECLPLILEPQSAFYKGPVLVLDFQSLYPSVMIAYNICYSTCLGRVSKFQGVDKFGFSELSVPEGLITLLQDDINISANGLVYVKPHVRKSLLAKMLTEILDTRVMVKGSIKGRKSDKSFVRTQNARQLSLKLLANVTYGYTSATFSGRMPCVEIADSIVQYGRETLEKAIALIHANTSWGAQVVYGDTDSLFIYLPDRSKDEAFRIGNEISEAITAANPKPIKLKFEKVYLPSVLLAKKRYVGFKYEAPDEVTPEFNAKGIETVRRDGFPMLQRMLETCIRILFTSQDLSLVKSYCQKQWRSILASHAAINDFIIAKEVRLGGYSENGVPPPGAAVSTRRMLTDARLEPQHAERVPYLITLGEPKAKLNDLAVDPGTMLANPMLQLNAMYYITRGIIPPLTRIFNLLGADVEQWFREMPRPSGANPLDDDYEAPAGVQPAVSGAGGTAYSPAKRSTLRSLTLTGHYRRNVCLSCSRSLPSQATTQQHGSAAGASSHLCLDCLAAPSRSLFTVQSDYTASTRRLDAVEDVCAHCSHLTRGNGGTLMATSSSTSSGSNSNNNNSSSTSSGVGLGLSSGAGSPCVSWDCPILYERQKSRANEVRQRNRLAKVQIAIEQALDDAR